MNDIIKIVKALEDSNILLKGVTKTIENETKEQKGSQVLGELDNSHEEFFMILNEKDKYEKIKYNLISKNGDEKQ